MPTFTELLESSPLFGRETGRTRPPDYNRRLDEAVRLVERVSSGDRLAAIAFTEAMGTSDFPQLFGDVLDRALVGAYQAWPNDILQVTDQRSRRDFRTASTFALDGAEGTLDKVPEQSEYPEASLSDTEDTISVDKYGRILALDWESLVNDDLDAFRDIPNRHARAAARSENKLVTQQYADSDGPHDSLYSNGNGNLVNTTNDASADNPALSVSGLQDGYTVLGNQVDEDDEPIVVEGVYLVVPPALKVTAMNILNAIEIRAETSGGGTSAQTIVARNWLSGELNLIVDPYLPIVATTNNGGTSWFLFANPASTRAAVEFARLRGHEQPEIWVKEPNARRVGGGTVGPDQGDFETDSIRYRVRHVFGAGRRTNTGGEKSTVASDGSGS